MLKYAVAIFICLFLVTTSVPQTKLACVGNSITQGYNAPSYTENLKTLLGSGYTVLNAGVSGCTLLKKGDKPYWTQGKLSDVVAFKPDIVTILLGTNDTKSYNWNYHSTEFSDDYNALIDTIQNLPSSPLIRIVLPCPCWSNQYSIRDSIVSVIIPILKEIAAQRNIQIIDANTPFKNANHFFPDGVHPNATGADSLAMVFYKALTTVVDVERIKSNRFTHEISFSPRAQTFINISSAGNRSSYILPVNVYNYYDLRGAVSYSLTGKGRRVLIYNK